MREIILTVGQKVNRIEDRASVGATVLQVVDETTVEIQYDEGGSGFWSVSSLIAQ